MESLSVYMSFSGHRIAYKGSINSVIGKVTVIKILCLCGTSVTDYSQIGGGGEFVFQTLL